MAVEADLRLSRSVTNVYGKGNGESKVVHHDTDFDTEFAEIVANMDA